MEVFQIKDKSQFFCKLVGIDEKDSCKAYIQLLDQNIWEDYASMMKSVNKEYSTSCRKLKINFTEMKIGQEVIMKTQFNAMNTQDNFIRAKINDLVSDKIIKCVDLDDFKEYTIPAEHIFQMTNEAKAHPYMTVKVCLEHLFLFDLLPFAARAFRLTHLFEESIFLGTCMRHENRWESEQPVIRLLTYRGENLSNEILLHLECKVLMPKKGMLPKEVLITLSNDSGKIWFQYNNDELVLRIQESLYILNGLEVKSEKYARLKKNVRLRLADPDIHFGALYYEDGSYYRAIVKDVIDEEMVEVEFIDYGNTQIMKIDDLFDIGEMDKALEFIPGRCQKAQLRRVKYMDVKAVTELLNCFERLQLILIEDIEHLFPVVDILVETGEQGKKKSLVDILVEMGVAFENQLEDIN